MRKTALLFVFILAFAFSVFTQTAQPTPSKVQADDEVIKIDSRLVVVPVSVLDQNGQPITGLKAQDFRVLEENKSQEIAQVSDAEKIPLEIALLFDISGTTNPMFKFEQETAAKFLRDVMRPVDRASIFTIGEVPIMVQGRETAEKSIIALKTVQPTKQYTAFYDTVKTAVNYLQKNAPSGSRKVVIVISDGEDTNSEGIRRGFSTVYASLGKEINTITPEKLRTLLSSKRDQIRTSEQNKVLQNIQNADTVFYSINPAGSSYKLNKISVFGQSNMQKFADETGGTAYLPKFLPIDLKNSYENEANTKKNTETLEQIFRQLANELQAQYLVQYYSESDFPNNKYVKLDVNLKNSQQLRVRARQGYFVKN